MKNSLSRITLGLLLIAALVPSAFAAGKGKGKAPVYHDTVIASVAANSITITQDKVSKTYLTTQFTEITLKGQRTTLASLQPGMAVSITLGTDGVSASRIVADDPPVHFAPPKPVKPPKDFR